METNAGYILPVHGLGIGVHEFDLRFDEKFFDRFEDAIVSGTFDVHLVVEKQTGLLDVGLSFKGFEATACDRCLANVRIPVEGKGRLIIKFDENERTDGEIVFIHPATPVFDLGPFIYEAIGLALPIVKRFDCESLNPRPCNQEVLKRLNELSQQTAPDEVNNIWDELKKLKNK